MSTPLVIAHRGDSSRGLENSLEAIRLALSVPADMIELDVRKSRDNRLYILHDGETGRTAGENIDIEASESDVISRVRLRNGEPIPSLADALRLVAGSVALNVEIKSDGAGGLCAAQIAGSGYRGAVTISSFKEREVIDARRILPAVPAGVIFDEFSPADVNAYQARGYGLVSLKKKTVTQGLVAAFHERKIKVYVWTVDDEEAMKTFISWGVDGIYTNRPMVLKAVVNAECGVRSAEEGRGNPRA